MDGQNFLQSKKFKIILGTLGGLIVALLIFQAGILIGFRKASFSYGWGENYHRTFGGPREGFMHGLAGGDFISGHGSAGKILKIDGQNIIIVGQDGVEKNISVTSSTAIKLGRNDVQLSNLKVDESIVVIGSPKQDGSIEAKLIRVFDPGVPQPPPLLPGFKN